MSKSADFSRRGFLAGPGGIPLALAHDSNAAPLPASFVERAESERARVKIRDVQVMVMQGPGRNDTLVRTYASAQWATSIRDYIALETITGEGGWMDQVLVLDGPYIKDGFILATEKVGLGIELNPDVVRAHLAPGETWWG